MTKQRVTALPGCFLLIVAIGLVACSGGDNSVHTLRIASLEPTTLDPALAADPVSLPYIVEIFAGLTGFTSDLGLEPRLADSLPEPQVNADGSVSYTFRLRDDAQFHDGRLVTADDVRWSLERAARPATGSLTAPFFLSSIAGYADFAAGAADSIRGIEVVTDDSLRITTTEADGAFLEKLAFPVAFVVDRRQIDADPTRWARQPNGTGTFQVEEWSLGERIVLHRVDSQHISPGAVERVEIRFQAAGPGQLAAGEFDVVDVPLSEVQSFDGAEASLRTTTELSWTWLGFNHRQAPFDDPAVREAFALSIDRAALATLFLGAVLPATRFVPPALDPMVAGTPQGTPFDPEAARDRLAESEYAGGPELEGLKILVPAGGRTPMLVVEAVVEMWRVHLGVAVSVEQVDPRSFSIRLQGVDHVMFMATSGVGFPDVSEVIAAYFGSDSPRNFLNYEDADVDRLIAAAQRELKRERRLSLYRQAEEEILKDVAGVPLLFTRKVQAVGERVTDYAPPATFVPYFHDVRLKR